MCVCVCVQDGGVGAVDDVTDSATVSPVDHHHQQQHEEQDNHGSTSVRNKPVVSIDHFTHHSVISLRGVHVLE